MLWSSSMRLRNREANEDPASQLHQATNMPSRPHNTTAPKIVTNVTKMPLDSMAPGGWHHWPRSLTKDSNM